MILGNLHAVRVRWVGKTFAKPQHRQRNGAFQLQHYTLKRLITTQVYVRNGPSPLCKKALVRYGMGRYHLYDGPLGETCSYCTYPTGETQRARKKGAQCTFSFFRLTIFLPWGAYKNGHFNQRSTFHLSPIFTYINPS